MPAQFAVGVDLGTTNSVIAFAPLESETPQVALLPIPQLVAVDTVEARPSLPSFLYLGTEEEAGGFAAPLARRAPAGRRRIRPAPIGAAPQRSVAGAKSWLAHSRIDRRQAVLPWDAPPEVAKISPVDASREYLEHLAAVWNAAHPEAPLAEQQVVLTVPASFDASARELTREAAIAAGFPTEFVLLEEPQAAVYAWLDQTGDRWRRELNVGDSLLVCDVGGGTTDLTLIAVAEESGELTLQRRAVGNHLLVGGDNMDLAAAHYAAGLFAQRGTQLDPWQSVSLWHSCRQAKEMLLGPDAPEAHTVAVAGRGSKLIGGSVKVELAKDAASQLLVDGFFPVCSLSDAPSRRRASGFQEIGLPFEADTAVTRHIAAFLSSCGDGVEQAARPTHVLFNGGVFKAGVLRDRLMQVIGDWFGDQQRPAALAGEHDLENAVARGAAYYGWAKRQGGVRIRGGAARAYYVGMETAGLAIPGAPRPLKALCVVPMGMEEGSEVDVPSAEIGLVVGEPAQFRFFSSTVRRGDRPGDWVSHWAEDELVETAPMEASLNRVEGIDEPYVPVRFQSRITELGVFELWCVHAASGERWKLEFSVRESDGADPAR